MDLVTLVIFMGLMGIIVWFNFYLDIKRIRAKAEELGYEDIKISWAPFAPGFLFEKNESHFRVSYLGSDGRYHCRYCKTSIFTGVYWREEECN
jgi:hypothetical protein